jgi:hypothetical protein
MRDGENGIDPSDRLADGTPVDGPVALREALLRDPAVFVGTVTEKLMTYALGRGLDHHDMPAVRKILRDTAPSDYRATSVIMGIVNSVPFQMRMKALPESPSTESRGTPAAPAPGRSQLQ